MDEWKCPQFGCTKPLSEHLVTLAERNVREGRYWRPPD